MARLNDAALVGQRLRASGWGAVLKETVTEWWQDKAPRLGAALAYYTILSLAPMLLLVTPAVALVFGPGQAR